MQQNENALHQWLKTIYPENTYILTPLVGDASARQYYRLQTQSQTHIVMKTPPHDAMLAPFMSIGSLLTQHGIKTPQILAFDFERGLVLLEDFGDCLFRDAIQTKPPETLYQEAIALITQMQAVPLTPKDIPLFDKTYMSQELALFHEWFLVGYLGLELNSHETTLLNETFSMLITHIETQPQVLIHRDYHSRNIMALHKQLGLIDFQDAMLGPVTYDIVSLLKDCYIQWPRKQILSWLHSFHTQAHHTHAYTFLELEHAFDWCGLQRHLKVLGIFARLHLRDAKSNYLADLPRTFGYVMDCLHRYDAFGPFRTWMQERIEMPFLQSCAQPSF